MSTQRALVKELVSHWQIICIYTHVYTVLPVLHLHRFVITCMYLRMNTCNRTLKWWISKVFFMQYIILEYIPTNICIYTMYHNTLYDVYIHMCIGRPWSRYYSTVYYSITPWSDWILQYTWWIYSSPLQQYHQWSYQLWCIYTSWRMCFGY